MIQLDVATSDPAFLPDLTIFAAQLRAAGLDIFIPRDALPEALNLIQTYDVMPFVDTPDVARVTGVIVLGAERENTKRLATFRRRQLAAETPVLALGDLPRRQDVIAAEARLSLSLGGAVTAINLGDIPGASAGKRLAPCFGLALPARPAPFMRGARAVQIISTQAKDAGLFAPLQMMMAGRAFKPLVYTSTSDRDAWMGFNGPGSSVFAFSEVMPQEMAQFADIVVVTGRTQGNPRAHTLLNNHVARGSVIIDASPEGEVIEDGVPALRGPADLAFLPTYLKDVVLPNAAGVMGAAQSSGYRERTSLTDFLARSPLGPATGDLRPHPEAAATGGGRVNFLPTNGIGLGHAQRCSLVAHELPAETNPRFFAFPSCLPMISRFGFESVPLVSRTDLHAQKSANDILNFSRLSASLTQDDVLVFDGGFVYASIMRTVMEKGLKAVWIRRGLWKASQDNRIPLDREKAFARVIVPQEAMGSLNDVYTTGDHIHTVGPIVQRIPDGISRDAVRAGLKEEFGLEFDRLIITMLGSGVLNDRSAHAQAVASYAEARGDVLNLMVVWPTTVVPPVWYGWNRTRVVATHHAAFLLKAADLLVSAVGFNTFHEVLYNQVPAILVPSTSSLLDDQDRRAESAADMGLTSLVPSTRVGLLTRELTRLLDRGRVDDMRGALAAADLPEPGNARAAELIAELVT